MWKQRLCNIYASVNLLSTVSVCLSSKIIIIYITFLSVSTLFAARRNEDLLIYIRQICVVFVIGVNIISEHAVT